MKGSLLRGCVVDDIQLKEAGARDEVILGCTQAHYLQKATLSPSIKLHQ